MKLNRAQQLVYGDAILLGMAIGRGGAGESKPERVNQSLLPTPSSTEKVVFGKIADPLATISCGGNISSSSSSKAASSPFQTFLGITGMDHEIPNDILVERPNPNEVASTVPGHDDCILVRTWLIPQAGLLFLISLMLKEVMARCGLTFMQVSTNFVRTAFVVDTLMRKEGLPFSTSDLLNVYTVVRPKREPGTNIFAGNHYLKLRNSQQPWSRMVTENPDNDLYLDEFVWVSKNWKFRPGDDGLWSFSRTYGSIDGGFNKPLQGRF
ncbi:hypothetical protein Acr_02g0010270 [Actinidia rufa]|uniref:Uncharacterized protein n=1 Tax=Actinidia rufa TaxID=165716 RepID=A0A7J0EAV3_9ERIC|nr:hypothetical protein Acr_02g0010270 [Actinidia rufa]